MTDAPDDRSADLRSDDAGSPNQGAESPEEGQDAMEQAEDATVDDGDD